jgi:hypothetical protein
VGKGGVGVSLQLILIMWPQAVQQTHCGGGEGGRGGLAWDR